MRGGITSSTRSTSASVLNRPREKRTDPCAKLNGTPMARSTCDGSNVPEVHADPDEAQIPAWSSMSRIASPSTFLKLTFAVPGSLSAASPLRRAFGISSSFASRRSRRPRTRVRSSQT